MAHRQRISQESSPSCDTSLNNPAIIQGVTTTNNNGGRAIDRYEDAIVNVLGHCDQGHDLEGACQWESGFWNITSGRLLSLVQVWCAVAGVVVPS